MKKLLFAAVWLLLLLPSCLDSEVDEYEAWALENNAFIASLDTFEYRPMAPSWAPDHPIYIKWHNDRSQTAGNLVPISTSTVRVKYEMEDINGKSLGNSYKSNGDSIYETQPNLNIVGFWATLTCMHVGDSVSVVIPYISAYNNVSRGSIKPYSNLIYHLKLVSMPAYEKP